MADIKELDEIYMVEIGGTSKNNELWPIKELMKMKKCSRVIKVGTEGDVNLEYCWNWWNGSMT